MSPLELLTEPELRGLDLDSPVRIAIHRKILARKPMIRGVFADFYHLCRQLDERFFGHTPGQRVELGAGVSLFRDYYPDVLVTDVVPAEHLDAVVDAQNTHFAAGTVRAVYGLNCFHHFPDPGRFLRELSRILHPGGGCVLVEPYYGRIASLLYRRIFASETFDTLVPGWARDASASGAMVGANQAASYVVFVRDRERFTSLFPELEIVCQRPIPNYLRYLLSGGLNFRPLVPAVLSPPLSLLEVVLSPLTSILALHYVIVLRKRAFA
jgi:SAM-dependent methyltransferase